MSRRGLAPAGVLVAVALAGCASTGTRTAKLTTAATSTSPRTVTQTTTATATSTACDPPVPALRPSVCVPRSEKLTLLPGVPKGPQGVDVSDYQGAVHWTRAHEEGVDWAYAQYGDGLTFRDSTFAANVRELRGLRLPWGAYLFLRPGAGSRQGRDLGEAVKAQLGEHALPPAIDAEVPDSYQQVCAAVKAARRADGWSDVVLYTAPGLWPAGTPACGATLWVADYGVIAPALPPGFASHVAWQWQDGALPATGSVDRDVATGILKLSYGRTIELPHVEETRTGLRAERRRQHCQEALKGVERYRGNAVECRRELAGGTRLTRRARRLRRS